MQPIYTGRGGYPFALLLLTRSRNCTAPWQLCPASAGLAFRVITKEHFWVCNSILAYGQGFHQCARAAQASPQPTVTQHCLPVSCVLPDQGGLMHQFKKSPVKSTNTLPSRLHLSDILLDGADVSEACSFSNGCFSFSLHLLSFCKAPSASVCIPGVLTPPDLKCWEEVGIALFTVPKSTCCNK